jgi:choline dehydrogenase-like flavoprotein
LFHSSYFSCRLCLIPYFNGRHRLGSLGLTGHLKPIYELSAEEREKVVLSWQCSRISTLRDIAKPIGLLGKKVWIQTSPMFRKLSGWTDLPEGYRPAPAAKYSFRQFRRGIEPEVLETDVVVVGSGCGGGVCAKVLAEAGHRVLVVDKGYYFPPAQLPMRTEAAEANLFENGGLISVDDGCMSVLAGSSWGGGGVVNWGVSMEPPQYVREEWAKKRGLPFFTSQGFQDSLDRVCEFMGVSDKTVRQNHRGQVLLVGAKKLGWQAKVTPHNSGKKDHHCGHCHLGCGSAGKKGPAVSWLPAAAEAGAEFIEGFKVERILFDTFASGKKASGVIGQWISRGSNGNVHESPDQRVTRTISIKAKRVVISCGTLWSPVILRNSGLAVCEVLWRVLRPCF